LLEPGVPSLAVPNALKLIPVLVPRFVKTKGDPAKEQVPFIGTLAQSFAEPGPRPSRTKSSGVAVKVMI
jgi:hypothetical protein